MNLLKSAVLISAMTMLSRITGLIRETLTARVLGAGGVSDAFFIAFRIPNLLRRLFAEGAFSHAFIPILAQVYGQEGKRASLDLARRACSLLFVAVLVITILGTVGASWVVMLMAGGLEPQSDQWVLAVRLTQWMFPYILSVSMVALASGVLNTFRLFSLPAFAPVLLNVSFIGSALFLVPYFEQPVFAMAFSVMLGGVLQVLVLWWGLWRSQAWLNPFAGLSGLRVAFQDERVRGILKNMLPASLAVSVAQVSLIINTNIASHLGAGSVSWISFGDRLMEFPVALLGVALGTVLLPSLSAAATRSQADYSNLLDWGLRLTVALALPAAVGLGVFSEALVSILFHYGRFDAHDVVMTSHAVVAYSVGLLGLVLVKILAPGFYARQDVRTPVKVAIAVVLLTQLMNLCLVPWLGHAGLPLSIGLGATLNALVLYWGLRRRGLFEPAPGWFGFLWRVMLASGAMGVGLWWGERYFDWIGLSAQPWLRIGLVLGLLSMAVLMYFGGLWLMGYSPRKLLSKPTQMNATPLNS